MCVCVCVCVCADSSVEGLNGAVGHAGCSQPAILTAISGLSAVGDCPQSQPGSAVHAIAAPGLASAARANLVATGSPVTVNMLSGLNATRHPVHKAAMPAPASQTNSAREHSVCAIKPLKSVRGSPTRPSHRRDHRDNTRRITRLGKKPFPPEQIVPCVSAITRQA